MFNIISERISCTDVFCEKGVLKNSQNSQENTCARVSFSIKLQALGLETLAQVFSCEFLEMFKNNFLIEP